MSRYSTRSGGDSGGFSTSFSDMVFGLLFVFFLLSIALIFQRPEIDTFQDKIDGLQGALQERTASLSRINAKQVLLEKANTGLRRQVKNLNAIRTKLRATLDNQRKQHLESKKKSDAKAQAVMRKLRLQLAASRNQVNKLQSALERTKKRNLAGSPEQLRKALQGARKESAKLKRSIERIDRDKKEVRAMLNSIKRLLRSTGQVDILAEIQQMEKNLLDRSGEDQLLASSNLRVQFDPNQGLIGAELQHSETDIEYWGNLPEDELLRVASELREEYKAISASYTELEKREHQPRILLSVNPDTPYWQVQELLERMRNTIPVTIVPWDDSEN